MHGFIVRPFGVKEGIDFDRVEDELIKPALKKLGISGGTTGEIAKQGNIRTDMFQQLLIADVVIADMSIHNANVFYELGVRHAFRDKWTLLIKSKGDDVPFDLKTDRYLSYDASDPAATLDEMVSALEATLHSDNDDSPIFQLLPGLDATDPAKFVIVPMEFSEEVERAKAAKNRAHLQLLSVEVDGFEWKRMGLRLIGQAQFALKDMPGAKATWEAMRTYDRLDVEANLTLGTVYQRLGNLVESDQALDRALKYGTRISNWDRAEAWALLGRNAKERWTSGWRDLDDLGERQVEALISPHLQRSFDQYRKGFREDRNHYYSGLNALAMLTITAELADKHPEVWQDDFDSSEEAELKLKKLNALRVDLAAAVSLAIESKRVALASEHKTDIWAEISRADLKFLSSDNPKRVGRIYKKVLTDAQDFESAAARRQIELYQSLGILEANIQAALDNIPGSVAEEKTTIPHVILFTGHRIDAQDRETPRFPAASENHARKMISDAVTEVKQKTQGELLGVSGGACGGDILFHEVCDELGIPTRMMLALPKNDYIKASVAEGGADWVKRFKKLYDAKEPQILADTGELPHWLRGKKEYTVWQRSNLWMLHAALDLSNDDLTLIALWNGGEADGPGGTKDMVERALDRGATFVHLNAKELLTEDQGA